MRITTRQLKRIIAEEIGRMLEVSAYKHKGKYIVKNKQSGNIYAVSKFRPDHHERVDKEELQAWVAKKRGHHVAKPTGEKAWKRKTTSSAAQKLRAHKAARAEKQKYNDPYSYVAAAMDPNAKDKDKEYAKQLKKHLLRNKLHLFSPVLDRSEIR